MLSLLNRTILWELVKIFSLSLVSITGILLLAVVVMEAQSQGLGPLQILIIVPLVIPSTLPYTLPATTLFATCVVYGRLSADNEVLAAKAAGVNVFHLVWPAVLLGVAMSATTGALYYHVIPRTYNIMKTFFLNDLENLLYGELKRRGRFAHSNLDYEIHVKRVVGRKLHEAQFMHRDPRGDGYDVIAWAREAELRVDMAHMQLQVHMRHCYVAAHGEGAGTYFIEDKIWPVDFPANFGQSDRQYRQTDMTWDDLMRNREELTAKVKQLDMRIAMSAVRTTLNRPPEHLAAELQHLRDVRRLEAQRLRNVESEIQRRPSLALGCLCFVLIGCPVGIWFSRSDYLSAFVTCFLPIILVYYPLVLCGENLARSGTIHPAVALWSADAVLGGIALVLYWKLLKR